MQLESTFKVPVPVEVAWDTLLDYPRLARCMPGATVTGVSDDDVLGQVKVKLGPVSITYQGKVTFTEKDRAAHRIVAVAAGHEVRGSGTASAQITAVLTGAGDVTEVNVSTELNITGKPAQFGRSVVAEVSERLIGQFAENLARELEAGQSVPQPRAASQSSVPSASASASASASGSASGSAAQAAVPPVSQAPAPAGDSLDLLKIAAGPVAKRLAPVLATLAAVSVIAIVRRALRRAGDRA
ncbi:MAG TPA: SRPBCC family protein [Trebonia sp.]|jgi:carbon monoxide dehydrogenase subunit G|nr:SRPBCC family protein [Trebonia sp.]